MRVLSLFLVLFRIIDSNKECTGLEFPSKLQNNVQNTDPCFSLCHQLVGASRAGLCFPAAVPFALLQHPVIKALHDKEELFLYVNSNEQMPFLTINLLK